MEADKGNIKTSSLWLVSDYSAITSLPLNFLCTCIALNKKQTPHKSLCILDSSNIKAALMKISIIVSTYVKNIYSS